jgi:hypothetical protein
MLLFITLLLNLGGNVDWYTMTPLLFEPQNLTRGQDPISIRYVLVQYFRLVRAKTRSEDNISAMIIDVEHGVAHHCEAGRCVRWARPELLRRQQLVSIGETNFERRRHPHCTNDGLTVIYGPHCQLHQIILVTAPQSACTTPPNFQPPSHSDPRPHIGHNF